MSVKPSRSEFHDVRGVRVHVRRWGDPGAPLVVMLHGWMDMSGTFQFLVDAMRREWNVVAPDWPGYGLSAARGGDNLPLSLLADLDALLQIVTPAAPACIVAHSMAAQAATFYAGARPERVAGLVNLDGLAPFPTESGMADLERLRRWLGYARRDRGPKVYESVEAFAAQLMRANARLPPARARFLAQSFTRELPDGTAQLLADPRHYKGTHVPRFTHEMMVAALESYPGPYLWILGGLSPLTRTFASPENRRLLEQRFAAARQGRHVTLPEAAHNIQHDQPERAAALIEEFLEQAQA